MEVIIRVSVDGEQPENTWFSGFIRGTEKSSPFPFRIEVETPLHRL